MPTYKEIFSLVLECIFFVKALILNYFFKIFPDNSSDFRFNYETNFFSQTSDNNKSN